MKIVFCILGTFNSGGMERVLSNKANYLSNLGYDVNIITTDQQNRPSYFEFNQSIQHYDLNINYTSNRFNNILLKTFTHLKKNNLHKKKLNQLLISLKADIVISMFDNDYNFLYRLNDGSKKILEIHFSRFKKLQYGRTGIWKFVNQYRNKAELKYVKKYDRFVVLTEEDKGYWGPLNNIQVIPNASENKTGEQAKLINPNAIAIGRLDYQKGFDRLIHIWSKVNELHPDWILNIYGNGPLKEEFQSLINSLNLQNVIHIHLPVKHIKEIYLNSSMLLLTSRYEGLPMVLLEAQSYGLPLVSFACQCGPRDIITDGKNGFLVESDQESVFIKKVSHLINDESLRKEMGDASFYMARTFNEEEIMGKWIKLFDELVIKPR
ncbi:glycosyltransferase family 4 protein [Sphingobacterium sp. HJSM2_6]|uniref:glycosyltransferase family 4 protein n=1 Tax=Sphingobacterium sp. HJSM2_6 TaxID=3366264 RepID=UPI003BCD6C0E